MKGYPNETRGGLLRVGHYVSPPGGAPVPRTIPPRELVFEVLTEGEVYAPDGTALCGPGWVFVHRPGERTVSRSPADRHYECLVVSYRNPPPGLLAGWPRQFRCIDADDAVKFAHEVLFLFHHAGVDRGLIGDLVSARLRIHADLYARDEPRDRVPLRIAAAAREMDLHSDQRLTMKQLASRAEMSVPHLQAEFRKYFGISPGQYLIRQRIRAARHRLVVSREPVKVVADEVGYAHVEHFCRAFKKHTGYTPAAFRRRYQVYP